MALVFGLGRRFQLWNSYAQRDGSDQNKSPRRHRKDDALDRGQMAYVGILRWTVTPSKCSITHDGTFLVPPRHWVFLHARSRGRGSRRTSVSGRFPARFGTVCLVYLDPETTYTVCVVGARLVTRTLKTEKIAGYATPLAGRSKRLDDVKE